MGCIGIPAGESEWSLSLALQHLEMKLVGISTDNEHFT